MQRRRKQQLLTCNTPSYKCHSRCFITYSVLTEKKKQILFKKNNVFFRSAFALLISSLSFMLLNMLLNNLPISLDGPLNCFRTHVSIKAETCNLFHNSNSITISKFQKVNYNSSYVCFIDTLALNFKG